MATSMRKWTWIFACVSRYPNPSTRSRYTWPMPAAANAIVIPNMPPTCSQNAQSPTFDSRWDSECPMSDGMA